MEHHLWGKCWRALGLLFIVIACALPLARSARCSTPVTQEWVQRYASSGGYRDEATAIAVDGDGNVYVTGFGNQSDFVTASYTPAGALRWQSTYDGPDHAGDYATALVLDGHGHVCVTGVSYGVSSNDDFATVMYDTADGAQRWVSRYTDLSGWGEDRPVAMAADANGNFYVTGSSRTNLDQGTSYVQFATISYAPDGSQRWARGYTPFVSVSARSSIPAAITVDGANNVYVVGRWFDGGAYATVSYTSDGADRWAAQHYWPGSSINYATAVRADGSGHVFVTGGSRTAELVGTVTYRLSAATGGEDWGHFYATSDQQNPIYPPALALDASGNVYVTDESHNGVDRDYSLLSYDNSGNQRWVRGYDGGSDDLPLAVVVDTSGNVYVTGVSVGSTPGSDYFTISYDGSGNQRWQQRYNGTGNDYDYATAIAVDAGGNVYVTGRSTGIDGSYDWATLGYSQTAADTTPPACVVGAVVTESPTRIYVPITLTDAGSGVAQVKLTSNSTNCRLEWTGPAGVVTAPIGTPITISPASASTQVRVVKLNTSQRSRVEVQVWDAAGNTTVCDPVIANLTIKSGPAPLVRSFNRIPQAERYITLQNGTPGLTRAVLTVNGRTVSQGNLSDGQLVSLDVAQWLRSGKRNVVRIAASGPRGAAAVLTIGDVAPSGGGAPVSVGAAGVNQEFSP